MWIVTTQEFQASNYGQIFTPSKVTKVQLFQDINLLWNDNKRKRQKEPEHPFGSGEFLVIFLQYILFVCTILSFETNINILCRFQISIFSFIYIYIRSYKYTSLRDSVTYTGTSETSSPSSSWFYIAASRDILQDSWNICLCWAMS